MLIQTRQLPGNALQQIKVAATGIRKKVMERKRGE